MKSVKPGLGFACGAVLLFALAMGVSSEAAVSAQDLHPAGEGNVQILTLEDGTSLNGRIVEVKGNEVWFESSVGTMAIASNRITRIQEVSAGKIRNGKYWFPNPNQTRLYVGPTARMPEPGTGYFSDIYIFFPSITYGLTKNFSMSGGVSIFPTGMDNQLFYFMPKLGLSTSDRFSLAASALITVIPDWMDDEFDQPRVLGIVFGVGTWGTENTSITAGLGFGYIEEDFGDKPAVILGGEHRISRRMALVTENWLLPGVDPMILSYGVRFFGEGMAIDLAFLNVASEDAIVPGIPYIDFVWNF